MACFHAAGYRPAESDEWSSVVAVVGDTFRELHGHG